MDCQGLLGLLRNPYPRLLAAAITAITTRHLIVDGFHYPMLLLCTHLIIALAIETTVSTKRRRDDELQDDPERSTRVRQIIHAIVVAGSLVFGYQSFLHLSNTTFWIMAISLNWDMVLRQTSSGTPRTWTSNVSHIIRSATLVVCLALLFAQEHRLTEVGARLLILAIAFRFASSSLSEINREIDFPRTLGLDSDVLPLLVAVPTTIIAFFVVEIWDWSDLHFHGRIPLLIINAVAGAIMLGRSGSIDQTESSSDETKEQQAEKSGLRWTLSSILLAGVTVVDNVIGIARPTTTTLGQWLAFLVASAATINIDRIVVALDSLRVDAANDNDNETREDLKSPLMTREHSNTVAFEPDQRGWQHTTAAFYQCLLHGLVWFLIAFYALAYQFIHLPPPQSPSLNSTYDLDIVIARYHEPLPKVSQTMDSILALPNLQNLRKRVILYNKGPEDLDLTPYFHYADEIDLRPLENVGREADTYLTHLLNYTSDDLAEHTLFIQAEPHDTEQMLTRIRQYFVGETGFLSLSNVGRFCSSCDRCGDISGWNIKPADLHSIYSSSTSDGECRDISLTYRGQFIVSKSRIRSLSRQALEDVRGKVLAGKPFGYTMERLWGVMFGCPRIASTCPSLLSGQLGNVAEGGVGECQCLD